MTALAVALVLGLAAALLGRRFYRAGWEEVDVWSIASYAGADPLHLRPQAAAPGSPALAAGDVTDCRAEFVADPFLVVREDTWWMFLEVFNATTRKGEIAVASSRDGVRWQYDRCVLREPFHLSYPQVFSYGDEYFMLPESAKAGEVRLYRAVEFPYTWQLHGRLLPGAYLDPTIFHHGNHWWLFSQRDRRHLTLHLAERPEGPWLEHPASPVVRDDVATSRSGGRILRWDGRILRFAQDGELTYGRRLRVFEIEELTPSHYRERELPESPVLDASGAGWNADGMHHLDAWPVGKGSWLAAVDGKRIERRFNWRLGLRRMSGTVRGEGTS